MSDVEREARRALGRLRRAVEKAARELETLIGAIRNAEGEDFPEVAYEQVRSQLSAIESFVDEEERRLQEKILYSGGLEPGRIRRG